MHCELDRKQKQAPVWYLTFGFHIRPYPQQKSFHSRPQTQAVGSWVKKTTASEEVAVKLDALLSSKRVYSTECCLNCRRCLNFEEPLLISFYSSEHLRTTISSSIVHSIFIFCMFLLRKSVWCICGMVSHKVLLQTHFCSVFYVQPLVRIVYKQNPGFPF